MAHIQPKEMPFCLARLMTIWVLDARGKDGMWEEGGGVSGWNRSYRQHFCKTEARVHKHRITSLETACALERSIVQ